MTTVTDEPFRADVDEVLARYGLDDPGHAVLASDLSDAFDEALRDAAAEVSRLRANLQMIESCAARDIDALFAENERLRAASRPPAAALRLCASLLVEWRRTPFFATRDEWERWVSDFGVRVDAALRALLDADVTHLRAIALSAVAAPPQAADRLAWAEAGAREMQETCISTMCYQCAGGRELIDDHWHHQGSETLVSCGAWDIRKLDPAAIARRAVEEQEKP